MHGLRYERPALHMQEYLSVLVPLLETGRVRFEGEFYRVEAEVVVPGTSRVPVLVGALSPAMVRVAGAYAHGVVTWLAGAAILETRIVPEAEKAAADAGRPAPRVVAAVPVAVTADWEAGRNAANMVFGRYSRLANYQRVLDRQGGMTPADLAVFGDETAVKRGLQRLADSGATEIWPVPFPVGAPIASLARTRKLLDELVSEHNRSETIT
jgi:F420-dependent oxidoreductase-like protein